MLILIWDIIIWLSGKINRLWRQVSKMEKLCLKTASNNRQILNVTKKIYLKNNSKMRLPKKLLIGWRIIKKNLTMKESAYNKEKEISKTETEELLPTIRKLLTEIMLCIRLSRSQSRIRILNGIMLGLITLTNSTNKST